MMVQLCVFLYTKISCRDRRGNLDGSTAGLRWKEKSFKQFEFSDYSFSFKIYNYFIWSMIQRGSDTSFTNLWNLLLYIQSLLHYIENAQENKKNTNLSYNIAENSKRVKRNEEKVCVCVCMDAGWCLVSTLND